MVIELSKGGPGLGSFRVKPKFELAYVQHVTLHTYIYMYVYDCRLIWLGLRVH